MQPNTDCFTQQVHLGGTTTEIYLAFDQYLKREVLLCRYVSDSHAKLAEAVSKLGLAQTPRLLKKIDTSAGIILVFSSPSPDVAILLMEQSQYTAAEIERFGALFIKLFQDLKSKGLLLTEVNSEDILIDKNGSFYLINHKNIVQWNEQVASLKRAQADVVRLMMQMRLGCTYQEIRQSVERHNGTYRIHEMPRGLDPHTTKAVNRMFNFDRPSPIRFKVNTKIVVRIGSISLSVFMGVPLIAGPVYLVKLHLDDKARLEEIAIQEVIHREHQRRLAEELRRQAQEEADRKRNDCILAIETSTAGDCSGQDLTGIDASNKDLRLITLDNATFHDATLTGAILKGMKLSGVVLTDAHLRGADFSDTTVTDVDWDGSDLMNADFTDASLENSDFSKTQVGEVDFTGADISHANLSGVNLSNQELINVTARGTSFQNAHLRGAVFSGGEYFQTVFDGADLTSTIFTDGAVIDESSFSKVVLTAAQFRGALVYTTSFVQSALSNVLVEDSEFSGTSFIGSVLEEAQFKDSVVGGGRFTNSNMRRVIGENTSFRTMDFEGVELYGAAFADCDFYRAAYFEPGRRGTLRNVILPDGTVKNPSSSSPSH